MSTLGKLFAINKWSNISDLKFIDSGGNESTLTLDPDKQYFFCSQESKSNYAIIFNNSEFSKDDLEDSKSNVGLKISNGGTLVYKQESFPLKIRVECDFNIKEIIEYPLDVVEVEES